MYFVLIGIIFIIAVFLVLVVLVQSGKGGGLAGIAAGGATTQILGTRQAPDVLEKATWTLGTAFMVLCVLSNFLIDRGTAPASVIQQRGIDTEQTTPGMPAPGQEAPLPGQQPQPQPIPDEN